MEEIDSSPLIYGIQILENELNEINEELSRITDEINKSYLNLSLDFNELTVLKKILQEKRIQLIKKITMFETGKIPITSYETQIEELYTATSRLT